MLNKTTLDTLKSTKNLLAFSAGGDSTTLLFLLVKNNIKFDIAIVNYGIREQSKEEVLYAKELALKYNFECHILNASEIDKNFEARARQIRYDFFEQLISTHNYNSLLTAHHLGDRFEWMLMQFCKGAGCIELAGMQEIEQRETYKLIRPLLHLDKSEIILYLQNNNIKYFEDETNLDQSIKRNEFRHKYAKPLLEKNLQGIKKSFEYIDKDRDSLFIETNLHQIEEFAYFKSTANKRSDIIHIDRYLKSQNYMLSASEREILEEKNTLIVGRKFIINQQNHYFFILPYENKNLTLVKEFKEKCRVL